MRARPDREGDVKALVKTNRLQVGPWYVQADELMPSGESLVRNLLYGMADAEHWGGRCEALYSPDAFGHPAVTGINPDSILASAAGTILVLVAYHVLRSSPARA